MECLSRRDAKEVRMAIPEVVLRLRYRRLKGSPVTDLIGTAMFIQRDFVEENDFIYRQEFRLVHDRASLGQLAEKLLVSGENFMDDGLKSFPDATVDGSFARRLNATHPQCGGHSLEFLFGKSGDLFDDLRSDSTHTATIPA